MTKNQLEPPTSLIQTQNELRPPEPTLPEFGYSFVIGKLWVELFRNGLLGPNQSLIPVIDAASPDSSPKKPQKPPPMKYKELPIYQRPHYEYKDCIDAQKTCPDYNEKLLRNYLLPHVTSTRKSLQQSYCDLTSDLKEIKKEIRCAIKAKIDKFKQRMRDPENLSERRMTMLLGGITGYYLASARGITTRLFSTTLGILAAGALCFPKETDQAFREFSFKSASYIIAFYNFYCNKGAKMGGRLACRDDLPAPPEPRTANSCPKDNKH